jgi:predicted RNA binding protein YcfA (HicA-like mRNA interferase family)
MALSGKELIKILKKHGWKLEHVRGSHHILRKDRKLVSVPVHGNRTLGKGLLAKLLKQTGLK